MNIINQQLTTTTLKLLGLLAKSILIFFLAKNLEPNSYADFGLLSITTMYFIYFLGFEFYIYSTREIVTSLKKLSILKNQLFLFFFTYAISYLLAFILYLANIIPNHLFIWLLALMLTEHLSLEIHRILISLSKQVIASVIGFIRTGLWIYILILYFIVFPEKKEILPVLILWLSGSLLSVLIGCLYLFKIIPKNNEASNIEFDWIKKGILTTLPFLAASLSISGVQVIDKYFINWHYNVDYLAAYIFYLSIGNALISIIDSGVYTFIYPTMIKAHHNLSKNLFFSLYRKMFIQVIIVCAIFLILLTLSINEIMTYINRSIYSTYISLFPLIMMATVLKILGMTIQYALYSCKFDKEIVLSNVLTLPVFIFSFLLLTLLIKNHDNYFYLLMPLSLCIAYFFNMTIKFYFWEKKKNHMIWNDLS